MRKLLPVLLSLPLAFCLTGCGDAEEKPAETQAPGAALKPSTTVANYTRSPFSNADPSQSAGPAASLPNDDAAADQAITALLEKASPSLAAEEALQLIDSARAYPSAKVCDLVLALLRHPNAEVRGQALTLVEGHEAPRIVEVVRASLADRDPAVRLQGVEVLKHLRSPEAEPVFLAALDDTDSNVRMLAFASALEVSDSFRGKTLDAAATSRHADVAGSALTFLEATLTKQQLPQFFTALDHPAESVRTIAYERLFLTVDKKFSSAAEALAWWKANQHRFDEDLVMIQLPEEPEP